MKSNALLPALAAVCLLGSCCTKMDCAGIDDSNFILFKGFAPGHADSVVIEYFETGTGLPRRLDSISLRTSSDGGSDRIAFLPEAIHTQYQYRVTLPAASRTYILDHFEVAERNCNKCFPFHPASDKYTLLSAYQVNGREQSGSSISITQ